MSIPTASDFNVAFHHIKIILRMMSDYTFLSSIEEISFKHQAIKIKPGYWKTIVLVLKRTYNVTWNLGSFLRSMKRLFIERFSEVSANHLKKFMFGYVFNSFYDFKNIINYGSDVQFHGNPERKDIRAHRRYKYYESKAKKHYLMFQRGLVNMSSTPEPDVDIHPLVNPSEYEEPQLNIFGTSPAPSVSESYNDDSSEFDPDYSPPATSHSHYEWSQNVVVDVNAVESINLGSVVTRVDNEGTSHPTEDISFFTTPTGNTNIPSMVNFVHFNVDQENSPFNHPINTGSLFGTSEDDYEPGQTFD